MQEKCFSRAQFILIRNACYGEVSGFLGKEAVQALYAIVQIPRHLTKSAQEIK
jgi:hypothetical protein